MRRLVAILLILLLPVQAAWALAGTVCTPQTLATSGGHDHHAHHADDAPLEQTAAAEQSPCQDGADHCANCHGGCCAPLGLRLSATLTKHDSIAPSLAFRAAASPALARPERPKWPGLA